MAKANTPENRRAVGRMAQRMAAGYYSYAVGQSVAANPLSINSLPPSEPGRNPTGQIERKDGTAHTVDMRWHLDNYREDRDFQKEVQRAWASGAILAVGDDLQAHAYFDRAPVLEMIYHLRNAVAHGNRFNITKEGRARLERYPANNHLAKCRSPLESSFEILPDTEGPVLFDYLGAGDLIDLLQSVGWYLAGLS